MTNVYLTDSDEEANVELVKDHKELYKTREHFKDKTRMEYARPGLIHKGHVTIS